MEPKSFVVTQKYISYHIHTVIVQNNQCSLFQAVIHITVQERTFDGQCICWEIIILRISIDPHTIKVAIYQQKSYLWNINRASKAFIDPQFLITMIWIKYLNKWQTHFTQIVIWNEYIQIFTALLDTQSYCCSFTQIATLH